MSSNTMQRRWKLRACSYRRVRQCADTRMRDAKKEILRIFSRRLLIATQRVKPHLGKTWNGCPPRRRRIGAW